MELITDMALPTNILNSSCTAFLQADGNGNVLWANMACEQLLSMSLKRLRKYSVLTILQPTPRENNSNQHKPDFFEKQFKKSKEELQTFVNHNQWITGTKQPLFVDYSISPFHNNGKLEFLIEVWSKDLHHRISQEHHDQHQYDVAKKMLRSVAHEVKNPLAGIRGAAQLLERKLKQQNTTDDKIQTYCGIIINETDRLNQLIKQFLGAQKLPDFKPVNIHIPLEHVLTLAHTRHPKLKIERDYDLSLPDISADSDQLIQVFLNLTSNAIDAMHTHENNLLEQISLEKNSDKKVVNIGQKVYKPTLTISTRVEFLHTINNIQHKQVAKITVKDNGTGIDESLIHEIFFPLVTGRAEGTGLGLSLVQDIINRHQGQIEVHSSVGETCFCIYLPFNASANGTNVHKHKTPL